MEQAIKIAVEFDLFYDEEKNNYNELILDSAPVVLKELIGRKHRFFN